MNNDDDDDDDDDDDNDQSINTNISTVEKPTKKIDFFDIEFDSILPTEMDVTTAVAVVVNGLLTGKNRKLKRWNSTASQSSSGRRKEKPANASIIDIFSCSIK